MWLWIIFTRELEVIHLKNGILNFFSNSELQEFSDCKKIVKARGNIINEDTEWDISKGTYKQKKEDENFSF